MSLNVGLSSKVIFLFGPTAVGKTRLLSDFFSGFGEVVNADSVQVYRGLDIGSAKADPGTVARIPHHLIDILEPWENYNVADFIRLADKACSDIWSRGKVPVVSGGTAFYFKHFMFGLSQAPQADPETRSAVSLYIRDQGLAHAYEYLKIIDPVSAGRINPNDGYRISRAIEVYRTAGKPLSSFAIPATVRNGMDILPIGIRRDKATLDSRIRLRVDIMFEEGMVKEMRKLLGMGAEPSWQSMQGIGYREFMNHVYKGDILSSVKALDELSGSEIQEIKDEIVMNSIHYAKRQMTFFRSFADVRWIEPEDTQALSSMVEAFLSE